MTTTFHLVRHAAHDRVASVLCGRMPGVSLGTTGSAQAERLAERFAQDRITAVHTSPLERARQTAEPIARRLELPVQVCDDVVEIDFGEWTGARFDTLCADERWSHWNSARAMNRPPGGESMLEAQMRILSALERLRHENPEGTLILISHSDVIKAALLYALGLPLDAYQRIEVEPASVSTVVMGSWGAKVLRMNEAAGA